MPLNTLSSVVLPDPFGPTKACTVLRRTESSTSSTALRPPKCFESWLTSRMVEPSSRATWVVSGSGATRPTGSTAGGHSRCRSVSRKPQIPPGHEDHEKDDRSTINGEIRDLQEAKPLRQQDEKC